MRATVVVRSCILSEKHLPSGHGIVNVLGMLCTCRERERHLTHARTVNDQRESIVKNLQRKHYSLV